MSRLASWMTIALLALPGCVGEVAGEEEAETVGIRTPASDAELAKTIEDGWLVRRVAPALGVKIEVGPEADGDLRVLAARLPAPTELRRQLAGLPVELLEDGVRFDGTVYRRPGQTLAVRVPDDGQAGGERESGGPESTWVVVGDDLGRINELVARLVAVSSRTVRSRMRPVETFDYLLVESRYLDRQGLWRAAAPEGSAGRRSFVVDEAHEVDRIGERDRAWTSLIPIRGNHVTLLVPPQRRAEKALTALAARLDAAAAPMAAAIPLAVERPLTVAVEPDYEHLGRAFGEVAEAVVPSAEAGAPAELHLVFHPADLDAHRFGVARALIRRAGFELPPWLADGAALWLSKGWYGGRYDDDLGAFAAAAVLPTVEQLTAAERPADGSRVIWPAVAAAVVERLPGDSLRAKLGSPPERDRLAAALAEIAGREAPPPRPAPSGKPRRLDGVSLAMSPGIEHAYHGAGVGRQLERFAALGANAVAVMPYAFQGAPDDPRIRYIQGEPGDENDAGLVHAARLARGRDFTVLWKPHVYVTGSWPGEIEMGSPEDWRVWWASYRRYVVHQAVLARFAGADLFSVGVELGRTASRERDWRHLIGAVRTLFPGRLTYAANWWGDFDRVTFWDALDLMGVDAYFSLAGNATADRAELLAGASSVVAELATAARRHRRPLLLTELGYAAREAAWVEPHEEGGVYDEADQRRAYEVFFEALGKPDWLAGVFLWKAFSDPRVDRGGPGADFRFLGRAAEAPISDYFGPGGTAVRPD